MHTFYNIRKAGNDKNNSKYMKEKDSMKKISKKFYLKFFLLHRFFFSNVWHSIRIEIGKSYYDLSRNIQEKLEKVSFQNPSNI